MKWGRGTARLRGGGGNDGKAVSVNGDIVWLRDDFRLDDQPAILAAADRPTFHVYVHDDSPRNGRPPGGAAKWRLARSLKAMEERLTARGARLDVMRGVSRMLLGDVPNFHVQALDHPTAETRPLHFVLGQPHASAANRLVMKAPRLFPPGGRNSHVKRNTATNHDFGRGDTLQTTRGAG
jgi:hypothetical protein